MMRFYTYWDIKLKLTNEQIRKTNKQKLTGTGNSIVLTRGKGGQGVIKVKGVKYGVMEDHLPLGDGHTMQHTDRVS